jgi:hypothetical protein
VLQWLGGRRTSGGHGSLHCLLLGYLQLDVFQFAKELGSVVLFRFVLWGGGWWAVVGGGWWVVGGGWWVVSGGWCVVDCEWWVVSEW